MNITDLLCKEDQDAVLEMARRMAKAAGKTRPATMAQAAYMLLQCAASLGAPEVYAEWRNRMDAKTKRKPTC